MSWQWVWAFVPTEGAKIEGPPPPTLPLPPFLDPSTGKIRQSWQSEETALVGMVYNKDPRKEVPVPAPADKDAPQGNNKKRSLDSDEEVEVIDVESPTKSIKSPPRPRPKAMPVKKARTATATVNKRPCSSSSHDECRNADYSADGTHNGWSSWKEWPDHDCHQWDNTWKNYNNGY